MNGTSHAARVFYFHIPLYTTSGCAQRAARGLLSSPRNDIIVGASAQEEDIGQAGRKGSGHYGSQSRHRQRHGGCVRARGREGRGVGAHGERGRLSHTGQHPDRGQQDQGRGRRGIGHPLRRDSGRRRRQPAEADRRALRARGHPRQQRRNSYSRHGRGHADQALGPALPRQHTRPLSGLQAGHPLHEGAGLRPHRQHQLGGRDRARRGAIRVGEGGRQRIRRGKGALGTVHAGAGE